MQTDSIFAPNSSFLEISVRLTEMAVCVEAMFAAALTGLRLCDIELFRKLTDRDLKIRQFPSNIQADATIRHIVGTVTSAHNLEQIGDHAARICETVYFASTGLSLVEDTAVQKQMTN